MALSSWMKVAPVFLLLACGTDASVHSYGYDENWDQDPIPLSYFVSGSVDGLVGSGLVLELNDGEQLNVAVDGRFRFNGSPLETGTTVSMTVQDQPSVPSQNCTVSGGEGVIVDQDIEDVEVVCSLNTFRVGGVLSGLSGSGLILTLNSSFALEPVANGDVTFASAFLDDGASYSVVATQQPTGPNQTCAVENGNGVIGGADVTTLVVRCTTNRYTVGGQVEGLEGTGLTLKLGTAQLEVTQNGGFSFADDPVEDGRLFSVSVARQPSEPNQDCTLVGGGAMIAGMDYNDIVVSCVSGSEETTEDGEPTD